MAHALNMQREGACRRLRQAREAACLTEDGLAQNLTACTGARVTARDVRRFERSQVPWALFDDVARLTGTSRRWLEVGDDDAAAPTMLRSDSVFEGPPKQAVEDMTAPRRALGIGRGRLAYAVALGTALGFLLQLLTGVAAIGPLGLALGLGVALMRSGR